MAAGFLLPTADLPAIYAAVALLGVGQGSIFPLRSAIIGPYFNRVRFDTIQGWMASLGATGGMVGPFVAGAIFETRGSYGLALLLLAAIWGLDAGAVLAPPRTATGHST